MNNKATTIEGNVKILYGLIGGVQTIVNMLSSLLDIYYFGREFKIIVIDSLLQLSKITINLIKSLISFQWIKTLFRNFYYLEYALEKMQNKTTKIYIRIGGILILLSLLFHKKQKENKLYSIVKA